MYINSFLEKILISLRYRLSLFNRKQWGGKSYNQRSQGMQ